MAYSNASVMAQAREMTVALVALQREVAALRAALAGTAPVAPVAPAASAPVVNPISDAPAAPVAKLHCVGFADEALRVSKACQREFGKAENLAQHNGWAHRA